jgi:hypothetical protein
MDPQATSGFSAACAAIATSCAIWVAVRDGRWRKSGLAKQLEDRIALAQRTADCWHESPAGLELRAEIKRQDGVLVLHDGKLGNVATQADIGRLAAKVGEVTTTAKHTAAAVDRIEGMLIRRALDGRGSPG